MGSQYGHDFTENLEAVARGVRRLEDVRDPELRDAIRAALGMPPERPALDGVRRARMRRNVLAAAPGGPRFSDRLFAVFTVLAFPAPYAVRALAICALVVGALAGTTVASADSMPDDALYPVKIAAEQLRLALAVAPADRAAVELSLAEHRLAEAERLASDGRESGALVATSAYAAHLASAAAELSEVDEQAPRAIALITQLEARLREQRVRAAEVARRLMSDPRTALAGVVLSTIATAPQGAGSTAAARIAESASAVSSRLSAVADDRASGGQPLAAALSEILGRRPVSGPVDDEAEDESDESAGGVDTTPMFVVPPTRATTAPAPITPARTAAPVTAPTRTPATTPAPQRTDAAPQRTDAARAGVATRSEEPATHASPPRRATPRVTVTARPSTTPRVTPKPTVRPTVDPSARIAAEKAKQSAAKAKAAVEKAKDAAKRSASPKPTPKPTAAAR